MNRAFGRAGRCGARTPASSADHLTICKPAVRQRLCPMFAARQKELTSFGLGLSDQAPDGYEIFNYKEDHCTKVILDSELIDVERKLPWQMN
ncbi:hypothetical protein [Mycobacterium seoulense]|uniref:hypothetical protein n=1 Tax=Mycobacterium seoulense TaxID=386911 RepID=UPI003CF635A6